MAEALHQAAVTNNNIGKMVKNLRAKLGPKRPFCNGHADRHAQALAQWPGGGFNPRKFAIFRVAGTRT